MCGTAAVSAAFRKAGYQVIASDIMTYAYHHAQVTLGFTQPPQFKGAEEFLSKFAGRPSTLLPQSRYEAVIHALNNVPSKKGFFWREFSNEGKPVTGVPLLENLVNAIRESGVEVDEKQLAAAIDKITTSSLTKGKIPFSAQQIKDVMAKTASRNR